MLKVEFLKRAALYGAVLSVSGCTVLYYLIQKKLASSGYYTAAVEALRRDERAMHLLGEPLRFQTLRLNDKHNRITTEHAEISIPVSGRRSAGYVHSFATQCNGKWQLDSVVLEFKGRSEKLVILDNQASSKDVS